LGNVDDFSIFATLNKKDNQGIVFILQRILNINLLLTSSRLMDKVKPTVKPEENRN
jgi:hypothetical protein